MRWIKMHAVNSKCMQFYPVAFAEALPVRWMHRSPSEGIVAENGAPFLLLPGTAPNERGRAAARRPIPERPARSLPNYPRRLSNGRQSLGAEVGSTRCDNSCWHGSWMVGRGAELRWQFIQARSRETLNAAQRMRHCRINATLAPDHFSGRLSRKRDDGAFVG